MPLTRIKASNLVDTLGSTKITDGGVATVDIADDAVTAAKLANAINTDIATGVAALPKSGGAMTGAITTNSTFDGVDIATRDGTSAHKNEAQTFTAGQRGEITALTDASSIVAGQSGSFFITQDGTGSRTLAYGSNFKFVGGTAPTLSTAAASVDRIDYIAKSSTIIHAVASLDVK
jgi:hypothetical protein